MVYIEACESGSIMQARPPVQLSSIALQGLGLYAEERPPRGSPFRTPCLVYQVSGLCAGHDR